MLLNIEPTPAPVDAEVFNAGAAGRNGDAVVGLMPKMEFEGTVPDGCWAKEKGGIDCVLDIGFPKKGVVVPMPIGVPNVGAKGLIV